MVSIHKHLGIILLLTVAAVGVHGYHLGADDAAIYVPAIKMAADPGLYPFGSEFFMTHAHLSIFSNLVGLPAGLVHAPIDGVIFLWHIGSVFLLLLAAWSLLGECFVNTAARWGGVTLLAACLGVPVAGTALMMMDPYLTARSLSAPASLFATAAYVGGRRWQAGAWLLFTALVHPQMAMYVVAFLGCFAFLAAGRDRGRTPGPAGVALMAVPALPGIFDLHSSSGPAHDALRARTFFFVSTWTWYEWIGIGAPLALCWWLSRQRFRGSRPALGSLLGALVPFGLLFTAAALVLTSAPLENLARLQPMRAFHLVYLIFFAALGGLLGEYVLRDRAWRWLVLFVPLATGMWAVQRGTYANSLDVEWPGATGVNAWNDAFYWIRGHTPRDAVFALDPGYMQREGEDMHGFRAVAERSMLADAVKDSGAVSLFPQLAAHWDQQVNAQRGLEHFRPEDFRKLTALYPVTWIVTGSAPPGGMACPYQSRGLAVCRLAP